jgi:hypothetical protein
MPSPRNAARWHSPQWTQCAFMKNIDAAKQFAALLTEFARPERAQI